VKFVDPISNQNSKAIIYENGEDLYLIKLDSFLAAKNEAPEEDDDGPIDIEDYDDEYDND
jgi:hypothetical protein